MLATAAGVLEFIEIERCCANCKFPVLRIFMDAGVEHSFSNTLILAFRDSGAATNYFKLKLNFCYGKTPNNVKNSKMLNFLCFKYLTFKV